MNDITRTEETQIAERTALAGTTVEAEYTEAANENWKRAFQVLALVHCRGFNSSRNAKKFIDALEQTGHEDAARLFAEVWAENRGDWMQSFMG